MLPKIAPVEGESYLRTTQYLREPKKAQEPWQHHFMPPLVINLNKYHLVMGQRKWKVQGGFPDLCHGGLSLLEMAVPFVELPPFRGTRNLSSERKMNASGACG